MLIQSSPLIVGKPVNLMPCFKIMLIKAPVSAGLFVYRADAHLAAPFRLCFNAARPEGHIPLLASTEQIEL